MKKNLLQVMILVAILMIPLRTLYSNYPKLLWLWTILYFSIGFTSSYVIKKLDKKDKK
ncbi:hypothetical protein [Leuconostoc suionicum]|uniref:hypothetical protein n=1 Tax=Leuconostoc suionicum TaxID=1511761 RepID=UPI0032E005C0